MKRLMLLMMVLLFAGVTGCETTKSSHFSLTPEEKALLASKESVELPDNLRDRLISHSKELRLTPEEMEVLKTTGKVILCGKCGYILNTLKYKQFEAGKVQPNIDPKTGFAKDSIRERILGFGTD